MPFIASYTTSYYARSTPIPLITPDGIGSRDGAGATAQNVLWIDASDSSTITLATSGSQEIVTDVVDKAKNYNIVPNAETGLLPTVLTAELNGLDVLDFSTRNYIKVQSANQVDYVGNHWSIGLFRLDQVTGNHPDDTIFGYEYTGSGIRRDYAIQMGGNGSYFSGKMRLDNENNPPNHISNLEGDSIAFDTNNSNVANNNQWFMITTIFNRLGNTSIGSRIICRIDGSSSAPGFEVTPGNYDNGLIRDMSLWIFHNTESDDSQINSLAGNLAEFMAFVGQPGTGGTDLSYVEQAEGYLAHKWGLSSILPSNHPYKYSAPPPEISTNTAVGGMSFETSYVDYIGEYSQNASVGITAGASSNPAFHQQDPYRQFLLSSGYVTRGTRAFAMRFRGVSNGQYNTNYPSPNRLEVTIGQKPDNSYFTSGWGDEWTIEMWLWPKDDAWALETNIHQVLFDARSNALGGGDNPVILLRADGTIRCGSGEQGTDIIDSTNPIESSVGAVSFYDYTSSGSWQHLAVTKSAGTGANNIHIFVDGVEVGGGQANSTLNEGFADWDTTKFYIGDDCFGENGNDRRGFTGMIQSVRCSTGNRYTSNFSSNLPDIVGPIV